MPRSLPIFVRPAPNARVIDPRTGKAMPAEGCTVPAESYWLRRIREGVVLEGAPPPATRPEKAKG